MATNDWFWSFAQRHTERFPRGDWPGFDSEFWDELRRLFVVKGVTEDVAHAASQLLFEDPPGFPDAHPKALLARVREVWRQSEISRSPVLRPCDADDHAAWNREAEEHWSRITDEDRLEAIALVKERLAPLAKFPAVVLGMAKAWAYDPTGVISPAPPVEPSPAKGPRRLFEKRS